jgi:hypothetical protein
MVTTSGYIGGSPAAIAATSLANGIIADAAAAAEVSIARRVGALAGGPDAVASAASSGSSASSARRRIEERRDASPDDALAIVARRVARRPEGDARGRSAVVELTAAAAAIVFGRAGRSGPRATSDDGPRTTTGDEYAPPLGCHLATSSAAGV